MNSKSRPISSSWAVQWLEAIRQSRSVIVWLGALTFACSMCTSVYAQTATVSPRKDKHVIKLLKQMGSAGQHERALKRLLVLPKEQLRRGMAYALVQHDTRRNALHFVRFAFPDRSIVPFAVLAMKWGKGEDRLVALEIVVEARDKSAIPVILSHVIDDGYMKTHMVGDLSHRRPVVTANLFASASKALHLLTDGKIGDRSLAPAVKSTPSEGMKHKWRRWWQENAAKEFPHLKRKQVKFKTETLVEKWCAERIRFWGEAAVADAEKHIKEFGKKLSVSAICNPGGDISASFVPATLAGPVHTAVLIRRILETSIDTHKWEKRGADSPAADAKRDLMALKMHRFALLSLSVSRDFEEVTSFLAWAKASGRIRDKQAAAYTLGRMRNPKAIELLAEMLGENPDKATLYEIVMSLAKTECSEAGEPLAKLLSTRRSKGLLQLVRRSLTKLVRSGPRQNKAVVQVVKPLLRHERSETVMLALTILADTVSEDALKAVKAAMPRLEGNTKIYARKVIEVLDLLIRARNKPKHH